MRAWFVFRGEPGEPPELVADCVTQHEAVKIARLMRGTGYRHRVGWYLVRG